MCLALLIIFLTIAQAEEGIGHVEPVKMVAEEIGYGFIGGVSAISSVPTRYRGSALAVLLVWTAFARQQILAPRPRS